MEPKSLPEHVQDRYDTLDAWYQDTVEPRRLAFDAFMHTQVPPEVCDRHFDNLFQYLTGEGDIAVVKMRTLGEPDISVEELMGWFYGLRLTRAEKNFSAYITDEELEPYRSALWEFLVHEADTNELKKRLSTF